MNFLIWHQKYYRWKKWHFGYIYLNINFAAYICSHCRSIFCYRIDGKICLAVFVITKKWHLYFVHNTIGFSSSKTYIIDIQIWLLFRILFLANTFTHPSCVNIFLLVQLFFRCFYFCKILCFRFELNQSIRLL